MTKEQLAEMGMSRSEWKKLESEVRFFKKLEDLEYADERVSDIPEALEIYLNTGRTYTGKKRGRKPSREKEYVFA